MDKRKIFVSKIIWSVTCLQTYKFSSMSTFLSVFHDMKKAHLPFLFWYMRVVVILLFCFVHGGMCRGQIFFFFFGFDQPFFITQYILHADEFFRTICPLENIYYIIITSKILEIACAQNKCMLFRHLNQIIYITNDRYSF